MASSGSSQSQTSYPRTSRQQPPSIGAIKYQLTCAEDEQAVNDCLNSLAFYAKSDCEVTFEAALECLSVVFSKGYSFLLLPRSDLLRRMMNHFNKLSKMAEEQTSSPKTEVKMLYILSMIAELIKENSKFYFPFSRKFLSTVFTIDFETLADSPRKNQILTILGMIYENVSRQGRLIHKYGIENQLKKSILENYPYIQELFTLKLFNRSIVNLVSKGIKFSHTEFQKHRVLETVSGYIQKNQMELLMVKMKMTQLWQVKGKGLPESMPIQ